MQEEKGEIQKRLEKNLCPWCMNKLELVSEIIEHGAREVTRQCTQCSGKVIDTYKHEGDADGNDT